MNKKTYPHLLIIAVSIFTFLTILTGCSSHSTDEAMVTTYTASGEYIKIIDIYERVIEVRIEDEKVKLRVPMDLLEESKKLVKGENVKVTYNGPPNIEEIYRLVFIETED